MALVLFLPSSGSAVCAGETSGVSNAGWRAVDNRSNDNVALHTVRAAKTKKKLKWKRPRTARRDDHVAPAAFNRAVENQGAKKKLAGKTKSKDGSKHTPLKPIDAPALLGPVIDSPTASLADYQEEQQPANPADGEPFTGLEDQNLLAKAPNLQDEACPDPSELKPIGEITNDISAEAGEFPPECDLGEAVYEPRQWAMTTYTWKASGLCHKPLYFEQVGLERYGHSAGPVLQPFISGAHFFGTIPILPYKIGLEPPGECIYALGYYRPGNCAPRMILPLGLSLRGALFEAGAATGLVFLLP